MSLRVTVHPRTPEYADHIAALEQYEVERQLRDVAGGEADHEKPALPRDRTQCRLSVRPADRIVDDIGAAAARSASKRVLQIICSVVDRIVGAMLFGERQFFVRGCAGDNASIHQLAKLDRRETRTARGTKHSQGLSCAQFRAVLQRVKCCSIGDAKAGSAVEIKCIR